MDAALPLRTGATGESVRDLQRRLAAAGHVAADNPGVFGPATEAAVRAFQERRGLRVDGICGVETWASLVEAGHRLGDRLLYLRSPMLRGDDVATLQALLGALGFDAGRVDGVFGTDTQHAVTEFQRNAGLTTDGICGPSTVAGLRRVSGRGSVEDATGPPKPVASLHEAEALRDAPPALTGRRIVIGERGGVAALADALVRALTEAGAAASAVHHPDDQEQAATANALGAAAFVGLAIRDEPGVACAYYGREGYESVGGRRLAELVIDRLGADVLGVEPAAPRGMRLDVLRATRMPAVVVELGPPELVVAQLPLVVAQLTLVIEEWSRHPV
jgi:N-acetylmuramoyl-L-alanine amidase